MKKRFCIVVFLIVFDFIKVMNVYSQQVINAGNQLLYYHDVIPDTTLDTLGNCWPGKSSNFKIDIDGDAIDDLTFYFRCWGSMGGDGHLTKITGKDSTVNILYGRTDSVVGWTGSGSWINVAKPLHCGDTINQEGELWYNELYFDYYYRPFGPHYIYDWYGDTLDKYVGIRYVEGFDTLYGWIRVNHTIGNVVIKDYSFNVLRIGISEVSQFPFEIFPNPANGQLKIKFKKSTDMKIDLFDRIGQKRIVETRIEEQVVTLNTEPLADGLYFLVVSQNGISQVKKVMILH